MNAETKQKFTTKIKPIIHKAVKEAFVEMLPVISQTIADKYSVNLEEQAKLDVQISSDLLNYLVDRSQEYGVSVAEMLELVLLTHMDKAHESVNRIKHKAVK